ncbi:EamA family transporter, partial [Agromyces sp. SYSU T0242]|uniref:EamA family transporter n=1 Tax=Agromyces litoreus TaxID=3158561 RepID=UPI003395E736
LSIALLTSRRLLDVGCAVAAGVGVFLLVGPGIAGPGAGAPARAGADAAAGGAAGVDPIGVVLALTAAASWAGYILLTRRVATRLPGLEGLTVASLVSLALLAPFAAWTFDASVIDWRVAGLLVGVGILSSALPYSLDTYILRRITPRLYAIITSFGPVIAAVFGALVLGERFTVVEAVAIAVVCGAAGLALATQRERRVSPLEATAQSIP